MSSHPFAGAVIKTKAERGGELVVVIPAASLGRETALHEVSRSKIGIEQTIPKVTARIFRYRRSERLPARQKAHPEPVAQVARDRHSAIVTARKRTVEF